MKDVSIIRLACKEASKGIHKQYRVGSIIVNRNGNIISKGHNSLKSHPLMGPIKKTHAEIAAISKLRVSEMIGATIYVARLNNNGKIGLARPCPICQRILREHGIKEARFTTGPKHNIIGIEQLI
jgi:tRNA(Arg) A34 adenosine deaminase TadA